MELLAASGSGFSLSGSQKRMRIFLSLLAAIAMGMASTSLAQSRLEAFAEPKLVPPQIAGEKCEMGSDLPGVQCFAEVRKKQDVQLHAAYRRALAALLANDPRDDRRNRGQLVKAQKAWLAYRQAHCTVVGAQEGGGNLSITYNTQRCESDLTDARIQFLKFITANEK
jgi:uncharacterized protein YecT (DUF1311 family)